MPTTSTTSAPRFAGYHQDEAQRSRAMQLAAAAEREIKRAARRPAVLGIEHQAKPWKDIGPMQTLRSQLQSSVREEAGSPAPWKDVITRICGRRS